MKAVWLEVELRSTTSSDRIDRPTAVCPTHWLRYQSAYGFFDRTRTKRPRSSFGSELNVTRGCPSADDRISSATDRNFTVIRPDFDLYSPHAVKLQADGGGYRGPHCG